MATRETDRCVVVSAHFDEIKMKTYWCNNAQLCAGVGAEGVALHGDCWVQHKFVRNKGAPIAAELLEKWAVEAAKN